jgi:hypothetical protein
MPFPVLETSFFPLIYQSEMTDPHTYTKAM